MTQPMNLTQLPAVIQEKVRVNQVTGCWEWVAALTNHGYGQVWWNGRNLGAHRVAYELLVGPIPRGRQLDHLCRMRSCINPAHLEPVTGQVNVQRGRKPWKTHCPSGHPYDEANTKLYRGNRYCLACQRGGRSPDRRGLRPRSLDVKPQVSGGEPR